MHLDSTKQPPTFLPMNGRLQKLKRRHLLPCLALIATGIFGADRTPAQAPTTWTAGTGDFGSVLNLQQKGEVMVGG
jgi:hypothetical protein